MELIDFVPISHPQTECTHINHLTYVADLDSCVEACKLNQTCNSVVVDEFAVSPRVRSLTTVRCEIAARE